MNGLKRLLLKLRSWVIWSFSDTFHDEKDRIVTAAIAAMDKFGAIGCNNHLLFHNKQDMAYFKEITKDSIVIMGRKTFDSLKKPNGLPGRLNLVVSRTKHPWSDSVYWFTSYEKAMQFALAYSWKTSRCEKKIFVIGGEQIYRKALEYEQRYSIDYIYATIFNEAAAIYDAKFPIHSTIYCQRYVKCEQRSIDNGNGIVVGTISIYALPEKVSLGIKLRLPKI